LNTKTANSPISHLPDPVAFFSFVKPDGYPEQEMATAEKAQPWKSIFEGPVPPKDGKLLIACPKGCDWGKFSSHSYSHHIPLLFDSHLLSRSFSHI
jgi:hypothetical protein